MQGKAQRAVQMANARGVTYADCRVVHRERQYLSIKNDVVEDANTGEDLGLGIRVIADGAWGFASTNDLCERAIAHCVGRAVKLARAAADVRNKPVRLVEEPAHVDDWSRPYRIDPFEVDVGKKLDILARSCRAMMAEGVALARASMVFERDTIAFANSEGSKIRQVLTESGGGLYAMAVGAGHTQVRSYPCTVWHDIEGRGWEAIIDRDLPGNAARVAAEARALISAPPCPEMVTDVIIAPNELALQIHESVGHPLEADRVFGHEADFAGTSFVHPDMVGNYRYGSEHVNMYADGTIPGSRISYKYDDEGVRAHRVELIDKGILVGLMHSRETAHEMGVPRASGCMRANNYDHLPLVRMANVSLAPGDISLQDLIASTDRGILLDQNRSWSIDDRRMHFQFGSEAGWIIEDGNIGEMVRDPIYADMTPSFWSKCDAVADANDWRLVGYACGKGTPSQDGRVAHGCSHARFRGLKVGSKTS